MAAVAICSEGHQLQAQHICARCQCSVAEKNHLDERKAAEGIATNMAHQVHGWILCVCVCVSLLNHTQVYFQDQSQCVSHRTTQHAGETAVRRYQYVSRLCCWDQTWKGQRSVFHTDLVSDGAKRPHITVIFFIYILEKIHPTQWKPCRRSWGGGANVTCNIVT